MRQGNSFYNKKHKGLARKLRNNMTQAEVHLWTRLLRKGQFLGYKFRRQRPIGNYIADFVCLSLQLIIEVDGITHDDEEKKMKDQKRDLDLEELGFTTLRFSDWEVKNRLHDVVEVMTNWVNKKIKIENPPSNSLRRENKYDVVCETFQKDF